MIHLELFYHPPSSTARKSPTAKFIDEFVDFVETNELTHGNVLIAGDFNIHINDVSDIDALDFLATTEAMCLHQHVNCATHRLGHMLDLVLTPFLLQQTVLGITQGPYILDHCMLILTMGMIHNTQPPKYVECRRLKAVDSMSFGPTLYGMLQHLDKNSPLDTLVQ